jgi:hypothetical protein
MAEERDPVRDSAGENHTESGECVGIVAVDALSARFTLAKLFRPAASAGRPEMLFHNLLQGRIRISCVTVGRARALVIFRVASFIMA